MNLPIMQVQGPSGLLKFVLHATISVGIVFHLSVISILPNYESILARKLPRYLIEYANLLNLNTSWRFFSPTPGPTFYFEYEAFNENQPEGMGQLLYWPPPSTSNFFFNQWNWMRGLNSVRYFALYPDHIENFFVDWVCRQSPTATAVSITQIIEALPSWDKWKLELESTSKLHSKFRTESGAPQKYDCKRQG